MASNEKKIWFYQLWAVRGSMATLAADIDWRAVLTKWSTTPGGEPKRVGDQQVGSVLHIPDQTQRFPALGMHKEVDRSFQTIVDYKATDVSDFLDDEDAEIVANSAAVIFLPQKAVIAIARGNQSSPGTKALAEFLEDACPLGDERKWSVRPVMDTAKVRTFREETDGVRKVIATFSTARDLLTATEESDTFTTAFDGVAKEIGGELDVTVTYTLRDGDRQRRNTRVALKHLVERALPRLVHAGKAEVVSVASDGSDEAILSLVEGKFCVSIEVEPDVLQSKSFKSLIAATATAGAQAENEVYKLVT